MNKPLIAAFLLTFGALANAGCAVLAAFANGLRDDPIQPMAWLDYAFVLLWVLLALLFPVAISLVPKNKAVMAIGIALFLLLDVIPGAGIIIYRCGLFG